MQRLALYFPPVPNAGMTYQQMLVQIGHTEVLQFLQRVMQAQQRAGQL